VAGSHTAVGSSVRRLDEIRRIAGLTPAPATNTRRIDVASLRAGAEQRTRPGPCNRRCGSLGHCAFGRAPEHLSWCREAASLRLADNKEPATLPAEGGAA